MDTHSIGVVWVIARLLDPKATVTVILTATRKESVRNPYRLDVETKDVTLIKPSHDSTLYTNSIIRALFLYFIHLTRLAFLIFVLTFARLVVLIS